MFRGRNVSLDFCHCNHIRQPWYLLPALILYTCTIITEIVLYMAGTLYLYHYHTKGVVYGWHSILVSCTITTEILLHVFVPPTWCHTHHGNAGWFLSRTSWPYVAIFLRDADLFLSGSCPWWYFLASFQWPQAYWTTAHTENNVQFIINSPKIKFIQYPVSNEQARWHLTPSSTWLICNLTTSKLRIPIDLQQTLSVSCLLPTCCGGYM